MSVVSSPDQLRDDWLTKLGELVKLMRQWAGELGWSIRQIQVILNDSQIGSYAAPALLLQDDAVRILLEPIARSAPGTEGVVDLYLMPAYDDIATLYFYDGDWHLHYLFPDAPMAGNIRDAESKPLTKEAFQEVLEAMKINAVQ